jgi:hypothetical protein
VVNEPLHLAYESARDRMPGVTFEQFAAEVAGFDVHPVKARGRLCGAILVRGNEMHPCVMPWAFGYWFGRAEAALLNQIIDTHGEATTTATTEEGRRFIERLGFINDNGIYRSTRKWALNRSLRQRRQ